MISRIIKFLSLKIFLIFLFTVPVFAGSKIVNGKEIKSQAHGFFSENQKALDLLVSDKRTYFPCSSKLDFHLRTANDWSTIVVSCKNESWSTLIRSTAAHGETFSNPKVNQNGDFLALVLSRNISKGQVIMPEDLVLTKQPRRHLHGSYSDLNEVVGRKVKSNLVAGTVVKGRHLETTYLVNEEDTVLVVAANNSITITTSAIALENGQLGDMIAVKNINSEKLLKVIITGKKKVAPITNM